ncbi:MAG: BON domain-containing protein [Thermoguttaceae bacterium]|nr:BON domain-containing protein [Thermoguttaceae bacterium]
MRRFFVVITCAAALAFGSVALANNQTVADNIEQALVQSAALEEADQIQVSVKDGVVTLEGVAASSEQRIRIENVVKRVPGVSSVNNRMNVGEIQQVSASILERAPQQAPYSSAVGQQGVSILSDVPVNQAQPTPAAAPVAVDQNAPVQYGTPLPMTSAPQYSMPDQYGQQNAVRYDRPYLPNYAWPSYAAYPNYAQVCYPKQYSANAWPYIGPVYPYPQVPLGWREVTLKWHDGTWRMEYNDGTYHGTTKSIFRPFSKY